MAAHFFRYSGVNMDIFGGENTVGRNSTIASACNKMTCIFETLVHIWVEFCRLLSISQLTLFATSLFMNILETNFWFELSFKVRYSSCFLIVVILFIRKHFSSIRIKVRMSYLKMHCIDDLQF